MVRVAIRLKDGRVLEGDTEIVRGDYGNRVRRQELLDKFHYLTNDIIGRESADVVVKIVNRLEHLSDVRELTSHLTR